MTHVTESDRVTPCRHGTEGANLDPSTCSACVADVHAMDRRKYPPGTPVSPTGFVVVSKCGRNVHVDQAARRRHWKQHGKSCTWCGSPSTRAWCSISCEEQLTSRYAERVRREVLRASIQVIAGPARRGDGGDMARHAGYLCALCGSLDGGEVDHIVPIVEGGDPWDLANLRVLCTDCHKGETRQLATRRAQLRRVRR